MEIKDLSRIGLTKGENKIYFALLKKSPLTKTELSKKADISYSKTQEVAEKLIKKGLISLFKKNNKIQYQLHNPSSILTYIEKKKKELDEEENLVKQILPKLRNLKEEGEEVIFEAYEGWDGLKQVSNSIINNLNSNSTVQGLGIDLKNKSLLDNYHKIRKNKKIKQMMIYPNKDIKKIDKKENTVRYLPDITKIGLSITDKEVILFSQEDKPTIIVIKHPSFVDSFRQIYEVLWKNAER